MSDTLTPLDIAEAADALLRDVDTLQDWISGECQCKPDQPWLPQLRELDVTMCSSAALLAFAFDRGQQAKWRAAALDELGERFLATQNVHVIAMASECADERIAA